MKALMIAGILLTGSAWQAKHHAPEDKVNQAFVVARTLSFSSTGPEPMRFDFTLLKRTKAKDGSYLIKVQSKPYKTTMPTNIKPGMYTYTVTATHAKEFFGQIKDGDRIIFLEIVKAMKHPTFTHPTDYLYLAKP